jgi:hypothetical protein
MSCKNCEFNIYGWMMWDKDDTAGFDNAFFVFGSKPTKTDKEQGAHDGDHQGHLWDSFPLYRHAGCTSGCDS